MGSYQQSSRRQDQQQQRQQQLEVSGANPNDLWAGQQQDATWWDAIQFNSTAATQQKQAGPPAPSDVSSPLYPDADGDFTFGADVSSAVGKPETAYNHGTTLRTVNELTKGGVPFNVFYDGERWRVSERASDGGVTNTSHVEADKDGTSSSSRTTIGEGHQLYHQVAVGQSVTNDRWKRDDDSLAYDMPRILNTNAVDVVGMQNMRARNSISASLTRTHGTGTSNSVAARLRTTPRRGRNRGRPRCGADERIQFRHRRRRR